MKLLTKFKKVTLFIIKQNIKTLETGLSSHLYDIEKPLSNGDFGLFLKHFYYK